MRAIREDKVAHAYLFAGPRGLVKIDMARFSRATWYEHGPTDHPYLTKCSALCKSILSGQSMDIRKLTLPRQTVLSMSAHCPS